MTTLQEANMTTLQEALATPGRESLLDFYNVGPVQRAWMESFAEALAQQELPQKERPDFMAGYDAGMADAKRMAQQREPVAQARLGMKDGLAMALSVVELYGMKGDVIYREIAKLRDGIAAAPAPQAQPAQASGRTNPGDETGGAVERFGWQTFLGKSPEIVPATNGSFVWYSDYLKLWQSAQPIGINGMLDIRKAGHTLQGLVELLGVE